MAYNRFRIPFKNAVISSAAAPTSGAGSASMQPLRNGGLNGVNLWGTAAAPTGSAWVIAANLGGGSGGLGVPVGYCMIALDGVIVGPVNIVTTAVNTNDPIYITSGNALTNVSASNTLFGYADEPGVVGAATVIGVRISNAVAA